MEMRDAFNVLFHILIIAKKRMERISELQGMSILQSRKCEIKTLMFFIFNYFNFNF